MGLGSVCTPGVSHANPMHRTTRAVLFLLDRRRRLPACGRPQRLLALSCRFFPRGRMLSVDLFRGSSGLPLVFWTRNRSFSYTREVRHNGHFEAFFTFLEKSRLLVTFSVTLPLHKH